MSLTIRILLLGWIILVITACQPESVPERFKPNTLYEQYWYSLKTSNLSNTALGQAWEEASEKAFEYQHSIDLPYSEVFRISSEKPGATAYRISGQRGQKLMIYLQRMDSSEAIIFTDLFRVVNDSLQIFTKVASGDSLGYVGFEPRGNDTYILRIQPELLRGGDFHLTISQVPSLDFPVVGKDKRAILSFFGDPRDGGRREHHGVDIFAKRHTVIVAPTDGYIRFVGVRRLGGKVIWLRDTKRGQSLYFAHLQEQLVEQNTYVTRGDTIGTVGNTGNARFTPPHLHFGIYQNGPLDPYNHIVKINKSGWTTTPDPGFLGLKATLTNPASQLFPDTEDPLTITIMGINHEFARVVTDYGIEKMVPKSQLELL